MSQGDSISRQLERKDLATRELVIHIADVEGQTFNRSYQNTLLDTVRYPEWGSASQRWTNVVDQKIRDAWHHLDDLSKLSIYLVARRGVGME